MNLDIKIEGLDELKQKFKRFEHKFPKITERSLNRAASGLKTDASKEIRKSITAKKKYVDRSLHVFKARPGQLSIALVSTGKKLPLATYQSRQLKGGVKVNVKKDTPAKTIPHSFLATMSTGHTGVFQRKIRTKHSGASIPFSRAGKKRPREQYAAMRNKRQGKKYALPITELFGPAIPSIMGNASVMSKLKAAAQERALKTFNHEIKREIDKELNK